MLACWEVGSSIIARTQLDSRVNLHGGCRSIGSSHNPAPQLDLHRWGDLQFDAIFFCSLPKKNELGSGWASSRFPGLSATSQTLPRSSQGCKNTFHLFFCSERKRRSYIGGETLTSYLENEICNSNHVRLSVTVNQDSPIIFLWPNCGKQMN